MHRQVLVAFVAVLLVAGCGGDENNSSGNIFTFNNINRQDMGGGNMDTGMSDAGMSDMGADVGMDAGGEEDVGVDMPPDMPMIPDTPTIMSIVPQTVVLPTSERSFQVNVTLAAALERNVRITATQVPDGVTSNGATIQAGRTSTSLAFTMSNVAPTRGFINVEAVALDQVGNPLGEANASRFTIAFTAPAKIDFTQTVANQILPDGATELAVTFDQPIENPQASNMFVFSDIRGLLTGSYDGGSSVTITFQPDGGFLSDERLEVVMNGLLTDQNDPQEAPVSLLMRASSAASTNFASPTPFSASVVEQGPMVRLDFDGDDDVDVAVFDSSEGGSATSQMCLNNGTGAFTCTEFLSGVGVTAAVAGDFDADGNIDLMVGSKTGAPIEQLCLNTDGTVAGLSCSDAGVFINGFASNLMATDANLDGRLDVIGTPGSTNPGAANGERVNTCINNGGNPPQFTCTESSSTTRLVVPTDHFMYDFNADGSLDFIRSSVDPVRTEVCQKSANNVYSCDVIAAGDTIYTGDVSFVDPMMVSAPFIFFNPGAGANKYDVAIAMNGDVSVTTSAVPGLMGAFDMLFLTDYDGDRRDDGIAIQPNGSTFACANGGGTPPSLNCAQVLSPFVGATSASGVAADFNDDDVLDFIINTNGGGSFLGRQ